jgi:hypothetical protein
MAAAKPVYPGKQRMKKKHSESIPFLLFTGTLMVFSCALINRPEDGKVRPELLALRCTEINYNPVGIDSTDAENYEFIEFKNTGHSSISLADVAFSNGIEYSFPADARIDAGGFIVLAGNRDGFALRYGFNPYGVYAGKLNNAGEKVALKDLKTDKTFLKFEYNDKAPWPEAADGGGRTLVPARADAAGDPNDASYWRASFIANGSPGEDDPDSILINEALTHTDLPQVDAVELYNPNSVPVNIGNWYITDAISKPRMFRIPAGTTIPANGYLVFDESDFNKDTTSPSSFRFSEYGEEVYLCADSTGTMSGGYYHGFSFGPIDNGVSFGRYVNSIGEAEFVAQKEASLGAANKGPLVGPVVFTEIMYNPADSLSEFIEIKNISGSEIPLYDSNHPDATWKINTIGFSFPRGAKLKAGEIALILTNSTAVDYMKNRYAIPAVVQIFTMTKMLGNSCDSLIISKPDIDSTSLTMAALPYISVDRVIFKDSGAWPSEADGNGMSLQRIDPKAYANDPANWKAADPTAGR